MSKTITITNEEILHQVKISCTIPEIVEQIVTRKIIENAAVEAGIKVETEELQQTADTFRLMKKLQNAEQTWAWLEKHSLSIDDFEEIAYANIIFGKLARHLFAHKVEPYFFENQLNYAGVVMYEVVLDDEDLAIELFYAIREGEISFYEVAHKYNQDKALSRKCGYKGIVRRQELRPEISAAVFAANPPQILKPILTFKGVHLILVEELIMAELNNKLYNEILVYLFSEWLKQQIKEIKPIISCSSYKQVA